MKNSFFSSVIHTRLPALFIVIAAIALLALSASAAGTPPAAAQPATVHTTVQSATAKAAAAVQPTTPQVTTAAPPSTSAPATPPTAEQIVSSATQEMQSIFGGLKGQYSIETEFGITEAGLQNISQGQSIYVFNLLDKDKDGFFIAGIRMSGWYGQNCLLFVKEQDSNIIWKDQSGNLLYMNKNTFAMRSSSVRSYVDPQTDSAALTQQQALALAAGCAVVLTDGKTLAEQTMQSLFSKMKGKYTVSTEFGLTEDELQNLPQGDLLFAYNLLDKDKNGFYISGIRLSGWEGQNCLLYVGEQDPNIIWEDQNGNLLYMNKNTFATRSATARAYAGQPGFTLTPQEALNFTPGSAVILTEMQLSVPVLSQLPELPTGCEATSWTMMARYSGADIDKITAWNKFPSVIRRGWAVGPTVLKDITATYCGNSLNLSGLGETPLQIQLAKGAPIVAWMTALDGFENHAVCLTGFDSTGFYYNDPWTGKNAHISFSDFFTKWSTKYKKMYGVCELALSYAPTYPQCHIGT